MRERTKTYALYASIAAAAALAVICVWLVLTASTARERGELLRDALFSETRLADGLKKKGVLFDNVSEVEGSPEELTSKLQCYMEMLQIAERHGDDDGLALSLGLLWGLRDADGDYGRIPGGKEAVQAKLSTIRRALSSENEGLRWLAALLLLDLGEESDLTALGKAVSDIPGGVFILASAKAKLSGSDEAGQAIALKELFGALGSEHVKERVIALQMMSLMVIEEGGEKENLFSLFTSEDPAERERAVKHIEKLTGEPVGIDPLDIRNWLEEVKEKSQRQETTDTIVPMDLEQVDEPQ